MISTYPTDKIRRLEDQIVRLNEKLFYLEKELDKSRIHASNKVKVEGDHTDDPDYMNRYLGRLSYGLDVL